MPASPFPILPRDRSHGLPRVGLIVMLLAVLLGRADATPRARGWPEISRRLIPGPAAPAPSRPGIGRRPTLPPRVPGAAPISPREAPAIGASFPRQVDTYPRNGDARVAPTATLYVVFDQPTLKAGSFSVADLDSGPSGTLLNLNSPRWSSLGDTVFLKPTEPMVFGHQHGMRVNTIFATDSTASSDLPIVLFTVFPRAELERIPPGSDFSSVTLIPDRPVPVTVNVRERRGNQATFTTARIEFWASAAAPLDAGFSVVPIRVVSTPVFLTVPASGTAALTVPVTLPGDIARRVPSGTLGLRVLYEGYDETGLPFSFEALSATVSANGGADTLLVMAPVLITPEIASTLVVQSVVLEEPLPGAVFAAGDTVRARATVTGMGTGPFRVLFFLDDEAVAIEEGFLESGRPVQVEPRGPIVSRRLGEHRLHVVIETPVPVASRPITFLCVPPPAGIEIPPPAEPDTVVVAVTPVSRLRVDTTYLLVGKAKFRDEEGAGIAWSAWEARYDFSAQTSLRTNVLWRLRVDEPENGSAVPEQVQVRLGLERGHAEWGDLAPNIARDAPLFASAVPRRAAQASWRETPLGDLDAFVALESRPRSAAGSIDEVRSDLYAARLSRGFQQDRLRASLYGGYVHDDPTASAVDSVVRSNAIYGGSGTLRVVDDWKLRADLVTVRHRAIEDVDPGRSRTSVRGTLDGTVLGFQAKAEAFRYQPDVVTALNPYALSNRKGGFAEIAREIVRWRFFGSFRREEPDDPNGAPAIRVDRWSAGGRLTLNQSSWVVPAFIRIEHRGPNTEFRESRAATELIMGERYGGETRARFDLALFEDEKGENARRLITSGSLVTTRRHPGRVTSTLSGGVEIDELQDLDFTDQTIQAALEIRWEAMPGKLLVTPFVAFLDREMDTLARREERLSGRLQLSWVRIPGLDGSALTVEGRIDRIDLQSPIDDESVESSFQISLGQRIGLTP